MGHPFVVEFKRLRSGEAQKLTKPELTEWPRIPCASPVLTPRDQPIWAIALGSGQDGFFGDFFVCRPFKGATFRLWERKRSPA